ncbi:MAG: carbohydrate-binding family 9-like protein [Fibrobacteres bacterium]|nr:carbohydrate-binding family 9-like protein [Fibrobacterota bacterium]
MIDVPVYNIRKKDNLPGMDLLNPTYFSNADKVLMVETVNGDAPQQKCEAALMYDSNSLYALFICEESLPLAVYRNHDDPVYEENAVELFIDPLGTGRVYYELEVNPLNTRFDALIINDIGTNGVRRGKRFQGFTGWNPASFDSRSFVEDGTWCVVLKIDFADLFIASASAPKPGDEWRGNLFRIDYDGKNQRFDSWSPNFVADYHSTSRFGVWKFC